MSRENEKLNKLLIEKSSAIAAGAELVAAKTNDWQMIKEFLSNRHTEFELTLTDDQKKKLARYNFLNGQLSSGKYTTNQVVSQLMKLFDVKQTQAYEDIKATKEIFSVVLNVNKQWELNNELESAKMFKQKCLDSCDFKAAALFQKRIIEILALIPDEEENLAEHFEGYTIDAVFDPRLLGAPEVDMKEVLRLLNEKRKVKINIDMFPELDHEEIKNDDPTKTL